MKNLIAILFVLVASGCGKNETQRLEEENKRLKAQLENKSLEEELRHFDLAKIVVGSYERMIPIALTFKYVFLENGELEEYVLDNTSSWAKMSGGNWKVVGKRVHCDFEDGTLVHRIEINGDLTCIAKIEDGKREDIPMEDQFIWKKLK